MAKKRFTDDLFGLFEEPLEQEQAAAPTDEKAEDPASERIEIDVPAPTPKARRKLTSKGFTADLDAFLSDSFGRESDPAARPNPAPAPAPRSRRRRKSGLDLLIQSTVTDDAPRGRTSADTKRVTLIFNKQHLAELKEEAKQRGVYLKDVVQEMVASYLEK